MSLVSDALYVLDAKLRLSPENGPDSLTRTTSGRSYEILCALRHLGSKRQ